MAYDPGDTVPLAFEVLDDDGELVDPDTITLTIGLPDGTTATPDLDRLSTGKYRHNYVPAQSGRYTARCVSTGPATAYSDVFDVRSTTPPYLVSLADTKAHLGMDAEPSSIDEELRSHIETATGLVEDITGEVTVQRTVVDTIEAGGRSAVLWSTPVMALVAVERIDVPGYSWDVARLHVTPNGVVRVLSGPALRGLVAFTYRVGAREIPARLALGAKELVRSSWETQRGAAADQRFVNQTADDQVLIAGRWVPPEVAELLGPTPPQVG